MREQTAENSDAADAKLRRSHRKSRNGCRNCKRRKVKCDELKPECTNCVRFGMPCDFTGLANPSSSATSTTSHHIVSQDRAIPIRKRGRGRPRRDWSQDAEPNTPAPAARPPSPKQTQESIYDPYTLNIANVELLVHFTAVTASTLSGAPSRYDKMSSFWADNAPRIGLTHHYVLHLAFSLASYHRVYLQDFNSGQLSEYVQQADHYFRIGLTAFTAALTNANKTNCGALDISAQLVCFCTFAAGPKDLNDLLICRVDDEIAHNWGPLIKGLRLIREMFDPSTLFSGLMAPLGPSDGPPPPHDQRAECARENFPRLDWEPPVKDLSNLVDESASQHREVYRVELRNLTAIYRGTYGDTSSEYDGLDTDRMVFGWLYRMNDAFVNCVRLKEPVALIIHAYFAVLLKTMSKCWYIEGWCEHLLASVTRMIPGSYKKWLDWPRMQVGMPR
ncbi:hypothetical protein BKA67DRAFT_173829 [Truncatella angustata]|uniref:Zn(2)-C6 fungal-type domain-containing protein n=1 Tax=Truncatella angustata TaxID=152316 RepID=A0A9P9A0B4_9PEZI|nr:uncharacterized protein BKA67DRAFT_173829 [Truncatella angustata]KAH6656899.1 hypothetical protein BKA67DRAFT_173829 [Truncatella angustata]